MNKLSTLSKLAALALVALAGSAAQAQVTVGVGASVNINVPGVYGRVDIGAPAPGIAVVQPEVIYAQPVVIAPPRVAQPPVYLYVPEAYSRDWRHHCAAYGACGRPVYFVREQWVRDRYVQHHPEDHRFDGPGNNGRGHAYGHDKHDKRDKHDDHDRDRDHGRDHDRDDHR